MHHNYYYETYPGFVPLPPPPHEAPPPLSRKEQDALRRAQSGRKGRWTAPLVFAFFLLLIGGTAVTFLALGSRGTHLSIHPFSIDPPAIVNPFDPNASPFPEPTVPPTTVERAPLGGDVSIALLPVSGPQRSFQEIYKKCIPSIVSILTTMADGGSSGTGVVLTGDGYIITNYHVIQGGSQVEVVLYDGRAYPALLVGGDQTNDLAVLKVDAAGLAPAEFGSSDVLQVGDVALAIGNPLGEELRGTMTSGIISAINRNVHNEGNTMSLIQTTAALNSGNSGGALLNAYGQVVGITNMKMTSYYDTIEGLGFAIPSSTAKTVVEALVATGHVGGWPTLGITGSSLDADGAEALGLVPGVYIQSVDPKSDAWKQGVRANDVVTTCNGKAIASVEELNAIKSHFSVGDTLTFRVYRAGKTLEMQILLMERYELDD